MARVAPMHWPNSIAWRGPPRLQVCEVGDARRIDDRSLFVGAATALERPPGTAVSWWRSTPREPLVTAV